VLFLDDRDIEEGEELLLSYGPAWEQAWAAYLDQMLEWHETLNLLESLEKDLDSFEMFPPQFRASVGAPAGMFPDTFFADECLGPIPCDSSAGQEQGGGASRHPRRLHGPDEMAAVMEARALLMTPAERVEGGNDGEL
jgi:hypothetical protein